MRALFCSRKRGNDYYEQSPASLVTTHFDHFRFPKKLTLSGSMDQRASDSCRSATSNAVASTSMRYPDSKPEFRRQVHATVRNNRFGISYRVDKGEAGATSKECSADKMQTLLGIYKSTRNLAIESLRYFTKDKAAVSSRLENEKEAIEIDGDEVNQVVVSDDSSVEEVEILKKKLQSLNSSVVTDVSNEHAKVDVVEKMMNLMQLEPTDIGVPAHIKLYDSSLRRNNKLQRLAVEIEFAEMQHRRQLILRPRKDTREEMRDVAQECFVPLSAEEVAEVTSKLLSKSNREKVLVSHEISNIDITGKNCIV